MPARRYRARLLPPTSAKFSPRHGTVLPNLAWRESPNFSDRNHSQVPHLVVVHRPVGKYGPSRDWLCNPRSQASAHVLTEGRGTGVDVATQLVPWDKKAWSCEAFNSNSYNIEVDDDGWDGDDWGAFYTGAHMAAWFCHKTGIPAVWTKNPLTKAGIIRHYDLGIPGGGHTDPTLKVQLWKNFIEQAFYDLHHTKWRKTYGHGRLYHI